MEKQHLTRHELYELVWSTPLTTLAKRFSITDSGLRKICVRMGIPLPGFGYWMKIKYNKPVQIKKLVENYSGENEVTLKNRDDGEMVMHDSPSHLSILTQDIIAKEGDSLIVPERLSLPHPIIAKAKDSFQRSHRHYHFDEMYYNSSHNLNITVTRDNISRALRFMDTFIMIIEKRGHKISSNNNSCLLIQGESIEIRLSEKLRREPTKDEKSWHKFDFFPTGIFFLYAEGLYHQVTAKDGKLPLEKQLPSIIARLEIMGEKLKQQSIEREIRHQQQQEQKRIEEEKRKRKEKEFSDFKKLLKSVSRWHIAEDLRNYLNKVEENAKGNNTYSDDLKKWIDWARKKADWYDPLISSADEYLIESDLDKFSS